MRGRYYAPAIGRFISRDPAGFAGGFNLYEYAGDRPTNLTDPTGLQPDVPVIGWPPGQNYPTPNPTGPAGTNGWYDDVLGCDGDVNRFCAGTVVSFFGVFRVVDEAAVFSAGIGLLTKLRNALEGVNIGIGLCKGPVVYGRFGSQNRCTATAFGEPVICAHSQARGRSGLNICELVARTISPEHLTGVSIDVHWSTASTEKDQTTCS